MKLTHCNGPAIDRPNQSPTLNIRKHETGIKYLSEKEQEIFFSYTLV